MPTPIISSPQTDIVTARTLAHLARVCASRGNVDMAVPVYRRIICIHEALPQPSNSDHAVALSELAVLLEENGSQEDTSILRSKADGIMAELGARMEAVAVEKDSAGSVDDDDEESSEDEREGGDDSGGGDSDGDTRSGSDGGPGVKAGVGEEHREREDRSATLEQDRSATSTGNK